DGRISTAAGETCDPPGRTCETTGRCSDDCRCEGGSPVTAETTTTTLGPPTTTTTTLGPTTTTTLPPGSCGNGVLDAGETCDGTAAPCPSGGQCIACGCRATVPWVLDDDFPTAETKLTAAGLRVGRLAFTPGAPLPLPPARLWAQDPAPGSLVDFGTPVHLSALLPPD